MKYITMICIILLYKTTMVKNEYELVKNDLPLIEKWEKVGLICPRIVFAQTYLETKYLTSKIYRENHNRFGMKYNSRGYALGERYGHAYYKSDVESMMDYMAWQQQMLGDRVIKSEEDYYNFLNNLPGNRRYAEDPEYTNKLRVIIKKIFK